MAPSAFDTGQPAFALLASSMNCASLMPGTSPRSVSALCEIACPPPEAPDHRDKLHALLDRSLGEYRNGDRTVAAGLLADFESTIFTPDGQKRGAP